MYIIAVICFSRSIKWIINTCNVHSIYIYIFIISFEIFKFKSFEYLNPILAIRCKDKGSYMPKWDVLTIYNLGYYFLEHSFKKKKLNIYIVLIKRSGKKEKHVKMSRKKGKGGMHARTQLAREGAEKSHREIKQSQACELVQLLSTQQPPTLTRMWGFDFC